MEDIRELKQELQSIKQEQKDMQRDIRNLETWTTVNEREIPNMNKQLEKLLRISYPFYFEAGCKITLYR